MGHYPVLLLYVPFRQSPFVCQELPRAQPLLSYCCYAGSLCRDKAVLPGSLIEALGKGKRLREDADYYDRWSEEGDSFALKAAGDFLKKAQELTKGL